MLYFSTKRHAVEHRFRYLDFRGPAVTICDEAYTQILSIIEKGGFAEDVPPPTPMTALPARPVATRNLGTRSK